jgi:hypothetical protein
MAGTPVSIDADVLVAELDEKRSTSTVVNTASCHA